MPALTIRPIENTVANILLLIGSRTMPTLLFYLGISALFTHELDAVINMEWRLLYHLRTLPDVTASSLFVALHFPFFFVFLFISHHKTALVRERFRLAVCLFLVIHGVLHFRLSNDPLYFFEGFLSNAYIASASLIGLLYIVLLHKNSFPPAGDKP